MATRSAPEPNGLGLLPATVSQLAVSGVTLEQPSGDAGISADQAVAEAEKGQSGAEVRSTVLAQVLGPRRFGLQSPGQLCWVVFFNPSSAANDEIGAPGSVELDAVVVNARTGIVVQGFVAFQSETRGSDVGLE